MLGLSGVIYKKCGHIIVVLLVISMIFPIRVSSVFLILLNGNNILPVTQSRPGLTSDSYRCHTCYISCPQKTGSTFSVLVSITITLA